MRRLTALAATAACTVVGGLLVAVPVASASAPKFQAPSAVAFDSAPVGTTSAPKTVTITNSGDAPLSFSRLDWFGPNQGDFKTSSQTCVGKTLTPSGTCQVAVTFAPTKPGTRMAVLRFSDTTPCDNYIWFAGSSQVTVPPVLASAAACDTQLAQALSGTSSPSGGASSPSTVQSQSVITLPTSCVSRRTVRIHLKAPAGKKFKKVTVTLAHRTFKSFTGKSIRSVVDLKGLPRGRFELGIRAVLSNGRQFTRTRHYVTRVASKG